MTISIGGRPISKVLAGYATAVVVDGLALVIDAASKDFNLSGEEWITLLVGSFGPPTAAYLKKFSTRDASQVIQALPADAVKAELALSETGNKRTPY